MFREGRKSRQNSPKLIEVGKNDKNHSGNLRKKNDEKNSQNQFHGKESHGENKQNS